MSDERTKYEKRMDELLNAKETRDGIWWGGKFYPKPPAPPAPPPKK